MVKALRGRVARVVVSLALAVGAVFVAVLPASPAAAASGHLCFPVSGNGPTQRWQCVAMHVQLCKAPCGLWAIDLKEAIVLPYEEELGYVTALGNGLSLVSAAGVERDPAVAARLLEEAKVQFLAAASILDGTRVTVGEVGFADTRGNQIVPDPSLGWLAAAGTDVGNGIWQMQTALVEPMPLPWIDAGLRSFISAADHIAYGR